MSERDFSLHPSYLLSEIIENYDDRKWWRGRFNHRINEPIQQQIRSPSSGNNIIKRDWDTLVVLDACRADLFEETIQQPQINNLSDLYDRETSNASATPEWLQRTFGDLHGDIVYVAGNPMVTRHRPNSFHKLFEVWREAYNPDTSVISPGMVTRCALDARSNYPNKRLIIHYMQPHYPFIGCPELNYADYGFDDVGLDPQDEENGIHSVWQALESGLVQREDAWEGYKQNLEVVFDEVETLLSEINDKMVVTSDHGNMLGGRNWPVPVRTYGHPAYLRNKNLIQVPWMVKQGEKRRKIIEEETSSTSSATDEEVQDRLSNLGYIS